MKNEELKTENYYFSLLTFSFSLKKHSGGYNTGAPPLPIPNREVKPGRADGTAQVGE